MRVSSNEEDLKELRISSSEERKISGDDMWLMQYFLTYSQCIQGVDIKKQS